MNGARDCSAVLQSESVAGRVPSPFVSIQMQDARGAGFFYPSPGAREVVSCLDDAVVLLHGTGRVPDLSVVHGGTELRPSS